MYILPFALHAKAKKTQENYTNASDATVKRIGTSSVSRGSAAKITPHGVVWIAMFHHAEYAKPNLRFPKKHLTSVSHAYIRHANAVHNDLEVQIIAAPMKI